jgi:mono/diheme cytochrome c family protein
MKTDNIHSLPGLILLFLIFPVLSSCRHTANIDSLPVICFEKDVLPVFQNNCAISGCHDGTHEGRAFNSYVNISREVTPGKPYSSNLYQAIIESGGNRMPPVAPLSLENRTIISVWIEQGANLTTCNDTTTTGNGGTGGTLRACYTRDIQPVLSSHCAMTGCHDVTTHAEGYVFYSYSSTMGAVNPGNASGSKLYQVLFSSGEEKMPPASKPQLTTAQIDSIRAWINYGALDQTCALSCDTINTVTFSGTIWPTMQSSCTGCHGGAGGVTISGYSDVSALAARGTLMNAITGSGVPRMPPGGPFTSCQIRQFQIWVNNGHLNN